MTTRPPNPETTNTEYVCDGACCRRFFIPYTFEELADVKESMKNDPTKDWGSWQVIAPMLIPLETDVGNVGAWYTCHNLDTETNLCKIYDQRPDMCRDFPYGDECPHCKSTCGTQKRIAPSGGITSETILTRMKEDEK